MFNVVKNSILALSCDFTTLALRCKYHNWFEIGLNLKRGMEQSKTESSVQKIFVKFQLF